MDAWNILENACTNKNWWWTYWKNPRKNSLNFKSRKYCLHLLWYVYSTSHLPRLLYVMFLFYSNKKRSLLHSIHARPCLLYTFYTTKSRLLVGDSERQEKWDNWVQTQTDRETDKLLMGNRKKENDKNYLIFFTWFFDFHILLPQHKKNSNFTIKVCLCNGDPRRWICIDLNIKYLSSLLLHLIFDVIPSADSLLFAYNTRMNMHIVKEKKLIISQRISKINSCSFSFLYTSCSQGVMSTGRV